MNRFMNALNSNLILLIQVVQLPAALHSLPFKFQSDSINTLMRTVTP